MLQRYLSQVKLLVSQQEDQFTVLDWTDPCIIFHLFLNLTCLSNLIASWKVHLSMLQCGSCEIQQACFTDEPVHNMWNLTMWSDSQLDFSVCSKFMLFRSKPETKWSWIFDPTVCLWRSINVNPTSVDIGTACMIWGIFEQCVGVWALL